MLRATQFVAFELLDFELKGNCPKLALRALALSPSNNERHGIPPICWLLFLRTQFRSFSHIDF